MKKYMIVAIASVLCMSQVKGMNQPNVQQVKISSKENNLHIVIYKVKQGIVDSLIKSGLDKFFVANSQRAAIYQNIPGQYNSYLVDICDKTSSPNIMNRYYIAAERNQKNVCVVYGNNQLNPDDSCSEKNNIQQKDITFIDQAKESVYNEEGVKVYQMAIVGSNARNLFPVRQTKKGSDYYQVKL